MSRIKFLLLAAGILVVRLCGAQFADTFSDGDFSAAPAWEGEGTLFSVVNSRLKLQAPPAAGSAQLHTASTALHEASWEFTIQLDFTPSTTNYVKVYLVSDQPDFHQPTNGYFVKIGNTSREVSLYRQTGSTEVELIDGLDDRVNLPLVTVQVRVTRDGEGRWELFSAVGETFAAEGDAIDATHTGSAWFGLLCVYTATRSDKFWFDNFVVTGTEVPDRQPPSVVRAAATEPLQVDLWFSETIALASIQPKCVQVKGQGQPAAIARIDSGKGIRCNLSQPLTNGVTYELEVSGLTDSSGNVMPLTKWDVRYFKPGRTATKCVLITEVFPDPSPQIGLPAAEYVELYNPGTEPFDLHDWVLSDGSSSGVFPDFILLPAGYVVLTSGSGASLFGGIPVIGLSNFPSLNNTGDHLLLTDSTGQAIDSVGYSSAWYRDEDKASGGWALELIDLHNPCGEEGNWAASEDARGGTPGEPNSVAANKPDLTPPVVRSVRTAHATLVVVTFNELLQSSPPGQTSVELSPAVPVQAITLDRSHKKIELDLASGLAERTAYLLRLRGFTDCNGNSMEPAEFRFGLSETADSLDVVISEVLFNPRPDGVDFVELFNASRKYVDLEDWTISNGDMDVLLPARQLGPGEWLALTSDEWIIRNQYPKATNGAVLTSNLPTLPDDEGQLLLFNKSGQLLDRLSYQDDWHSVFLRLTEGVSLERISLSTPAQNRDNWTSASSVSGFATPGLPNSQERSVNPTATQVTVIPEVFSPGSALVDFVQIQYRFDQAGTVASVRIFDRQGVAVKQIANNAILGTDGFFRWDGDRDNGTRAPAGYYVLWVEYFDGSGRADTIRRRIIIATP